MSEKDSITVEVDQNVLFDMVRDMKGNTTPLGDRLVGLLLSGGRPCLSDAIGLAVYGATVVSNPPEPEFITLSDLTKGAGI